MKNPWRNHPAYSLLLALNILALLPQTFWLDPLTLLLLLLLWSWGLAWKTGYLPLPNPWSKVVLTLIVAAAVLGQQAVLLGLRGGSALLAVMLLMKSLEIRTERDFYSAMVGLFFMQLSLLFHNDSWWMGLYVLFLALGMLALLWLLTQNKARDRLPDCLRHASPILRLALQALPLTVALFLLFPRLAQPLWGLPLDSTQGKTGLSDKLSPGDLIELFLDDTPVFRASRFQPAMPPLDQLYWRAMVLWHFDGRAWKRGWLPAQARQKPAKDDTLRYLLVNEAYAGNWLVSLDWPVDGDYQAQLTLDGQWISRQQWQPAGEHQLISARTDRQESAHPLALSWGLQLPPAGNPQTRSWARQQLKKHGSPAAFLRFVLNHFNRENFYYSLTPQPLGENTVDDFLFRTRIGYCEHYASALAFTMRAAGIPARVVTGYLGGEYNPLGQYIVVRKSDAHAWTEVWLKGQGWVRVDPTAAVAPERVQTAIRDQQAVHDQGMMTVDIWLKQQLDWLAYRWNRWFLQYNYDLQRSMLHNLGQWPRHLSLWMLALLGLLPLGWWLYHWQKRDRLLQQWHQLQRQLKRVVPEAPVQQGPEALARWARLHLQGGDELARWIQHWLQLRYGPAGSPPLPPLPPIRRCDKPPSSHA